MIDGLHPRVALRLSVQRALLGAIPRTLRAVSCETAGTEVRLRFVFDGPIDEDDLESARMAGTLAIADFPSPWTMDEQIVRLDYPGDLREDALAEWVFERKEKDVRGKAARLNVPNGVESGHCIGPHFTA